MIQAPAQVTTYGPQAQESVRTEYYLLEAEQRNNGRTVVYVDRSFWSFEAVPQTVDTMRRLGWMAQIGTPPVYDPDSGTWGGRNYPQVVFSADTMQYVFDQLGVTA